jgi:hypothetical protein
MGALIKNTINSSTLQRGPSLTKRYRYTDSVLVSC